jgi:hypothetical protein
MSNETNDLATLLHLAEKVAEHRDTETLCVTYHPAAKRWRCVQFSGDRKVADVIAVEGYATAAEAIAAFITAKR